MKACLAVGGGGIVPALTARKLGMMPIIRFGCCPAGTALCGLVSGDACFGLLAVGDVPDCSDDGSLAGASISSDVTLEDSHKGSAIESEAAFWPNALAAAAAARKNKNDKKKRKLEPPRRSRSGDSHCKL